MAFKTTMAGSPIALPYFYPNPRIGQRFTLNEINATIVSDLHIGSDYFLYDDFENFLESISEDQELILNGDIIDNPYEKLKPPHQRILDLIEQRSYRQKIVWVRGNHDNGYVPKGFEKVEFTSLYNLGHRLLIAHGDDFDEIMPKNQVFMQAFKLMHDLRVRLGARPVHVAQYAKKWELFYKFLRKNVMMNAVNCAMENGYEAVTCGHTHYPENIVFNGIRYINTGSWTERPVFYLQVTDEELYLRSIDEPSYKYIFQSHSNSNMVCKTLPSNLKN